MAFCQGTEREELIRQVTLHEMFHAFQHGFPFYHQDIVNTEVLLELTDLEVVRELLHDEIEWLSEGTATAAEDFAETMKRSSFERDLHRTDNALTEWGSGIEYQAQDFWVHFGLERDFGLDYLKPLFARGATTEAAAEFLAEVHQTSLGDAYWSWVKNQAIENSIDFDGELTDPCDLEFGLDHRDASPA